ncbi:ATP-binding protein [Solemya elarraichensis gill symbiont]|uniref:Sensory/regulatory protein RpfC n=1 Tax=Solemya elarraichensis gill symbiont TaxID=1918949 RepID=A0A1T2LC21_9GAMM|nr:ATP-binding protein [Solemya elarraichensis gill symbiont]OOZ42572.1 hypothetical protein BOW52_02555 [Solemya elarraichensis gill symbiont]
MQIRLKLLTGFLLVSLLTLGVSLGISLTVQQKVADMISEVGGRELPGVIALSRMEADLYRVLFLLERYESDQNISTRQEIEKSLALMGSHQTSYSLYDSGEAFTTYVADFVKEFSRVTVKYLLLLQRDASADELTSTRDRINDLLERYRQHIIPHTEEAVAEAYGEINRIDEINLDSRNVLLISALVIMLLVIFFSAFIATMFARPLASMTVAARKIGSGQLDVEIPVTSKDEIGQLSGAFNEMTSNLLTMRNNLINLNLDLENELDENQELTNELTEHRKNLEKLVVERTKEVEHQRELAVQANNSKSEFLASMSHEIRTPMNAVIGMTNLALNTELDETQRNFISKAHMSAEALLHILNDILDFSKIEAGKLEMESTDFSLKKVIDNTCNMIHATAEERGVSHSTKIAADVPDALIGDPMRLGQVLLNLINNAVKFTSEGGKVEVDVSLQADSDRDCVIRCSVRDNGIGISMEQQEKLFQPFTQADSSTTRKYGGTGLGLVICSQIVKAMDGELQVKSELGKGSGFYFTVRLGKLQHMPAVPQPREDNSGTLAEWKEQLKGARVLLVEDNEVNQELATMILTMNGIDVEVADNGQEALDQLEKESFDGVLMDCQMPVMDGYDATRTIRAQERFRDLPIIAWTANAMKGDREKALACGMNGFITKPINHDALFSTMARWIKKKSWKNKPVSGVILILAPA